MDTEGFALYRRTGSSEEKNSAPCCGMDTEKEDSAAEDEQVHRNQYYEICLVEDASHPPLEGRPLFQNEIIRIRAVNEIPGEAFANNISV